MEDEKKQEEKTEAEKPKLSILEETKAAIEELKREREDISKIKEELQQLRSDQLLSGTAGGRQEDVPVKEETALEYKDRLMTGGLNAKPTEEA